MFEKVLTSYISGNPNLEEADNLIRFVFNFWVEHVEILEVLIDQGRLNIIYNAFMENSPIVMTYLQQKQSITMTHYDYFMASRVGIFVGVFQTWIRTGKKETVEELVSIVTDHYQLGQSSDLIF